MIEPDSEAAVDESARNAALGRLAVSVRAALGADDAVARVVRELRRGLRARRAAAFVRDPAAEGGIRLVAAAGEGPWSAVAARTVAAQLAPALGSGTVRVDVAAGDAAGGPGVSIAAGFAYDGGAEAVLAAILPLGRAVSDADRTFVRAAAAIAELGGRRPGDGDAFERRKRAESLERLVLALNRARDVDDVLSTAARALGRDLGRPVAAYEPRPDGLRLVAGDGARAQLSREDYDAASLRPGGALRVGGRHVVGISDEVGVGAVLVLGDGPALSDADAEHARAVAAHAALALGSARAFEQLRRYAAEGAAINDAARTILGFTEVGALTDALCRLAIALVGADRASIYEKRAGALALVGSAAAGGDAGTRPTLAIDGSGESARHMISQTLPLGTRDGSERGALLVVAREHGPFDRPELRLLDGLATLAALAMRNVELYENAKRANDALAESNAFKDDLMAMFAHDFKGPLTVISGFAELLLESDSNDVRKCATTMIEQTRRLAKLSEDALALAATQTAGFSLRRHHEDVVAFVRDASALLDPQGIRIVVDAPPHPIPVLFDRSRLRHAFDNVVGNALKYSIQDVRIRVAVDGDEVAIAVADRGIGIPEADLARIFSRFGRGHNARARGISGSGVGLYIARKILEVHGGTLVVESVENHGSTFTLRLPLDADVRPPGVPLAVPAGATPEAPGEL